MRCSALLLMVCGSLLPAFGAPLFNSDVDLSLFRVTLFASGLAFPQSMQHLSDGSILVQTSPGYSGGQLVVLRDVNGDGIADLPGVPPVYSTPGPLVQLVSAGDYLLQGSFGQHTVSILQPGATPSSPLTEVGVLAFGYADGAWHSNAGLAVRPTPGQLGHYDLVFNVGAAGDNFAGGPVTLNGLGLTGQSLDGASLYMVTLDLSGGTPLASNLHKVASGIRNVFGLQFDSNGDLWFTDNGIDSLIPAGLPVQADELNRLFASQLLPGAEIPNYGFPTCFPAYTDGVHAPPDDCQHPEVAFIPLPNGMGSTGAADLVLAPSGFPSPYNGGFFIAFAGINDTRNPIVYYDPATGKYIHFVLGGSLAAPSGLLSTGNSLFISDWESGNIYQITSATPEPASFLLAALALLLLMCLRQRRCLAK